MLQATQYDQIYRWEHHREHSSYRSLLIVWFKQMTSELQGTLTCKEKDKSGLKIPIRRQDDKILYWRK